MLNALSKHDRMNLGTIIKGYMLKKAKSKKNTQIPLFFDIKIAIFAPKYQFLV